MFNSIARERDWHVIYVTVFTTHRTMCRGRPFSNMAHIESLEPRVAVLLNVGASLRSLYRQMQNTSCCSPVSFEKVSEGVASKQI